MAANADGELEAQSSTYDLRAVRKPLTVLVWLAVRAFLSTALIFAGAGVLLAGVSYYLLSDYPWTWSVGGAILALVEAVAAGCYLGGQRALGLALAHAFAGLGLGRATVRQLFERLVKVGEGGQHGERGGLMAQSLERLPLALAEARLQNAVNQGLGEEEHAGWLRRRLRGWLLGAVRKYTLTRFRAEESAHGGVDLLRMKRTLEDSIDAELARRLRAPQRFWTVLFAVGLPLLVGLQIALLTWLAAR